MSYKGVSYNGVMPYHNGSAYTATDDEVKAKVVTCLNDCVPVDLLRSFDLHNPMLYDQNNILLYPMWGNVDANRDTIFRCVITSNNVFDHETAMGMYKSIHDHVLRKFHENFKTNRVVKLNNRLDAVIPFNRTDISAINPRPNGQIPTWAVKDPKMEKYRLDILHAIDGAWLSTPKPTIAVVKGDCDPLRLSFRNKDVEGTKHKLAMRVNVYSRDFSVVWWSMNSMKRRPDECNRRY